ncbi:uncharacterized protein LOC121091254 isoform X2 [Falco naumanni]|uniref:uncharacterized protein LOC121091254 isoform X2 n=1 Tax=Falco naumanni TaxID=148594 RepID=UPI001ADE0041|nr:uncharacterized protein LOC121091254 isoform X2 [Falco naumanni]
MRRKCCVPSCIHLSSRWEVTCCSTLRVARLPLEGRVDAQEMKDSVKIPGYIERLAHKYMKCVVESSTESESESSVEVVPSPLAGGLKKARDRRGLEFLDPYDGDSEDASIHSDCSLNSLNSRKVAPWVNSTPGAVALEDADTSEDGESTPKPPDWLCPETSVSKIQAVNDCTAPLELPSQEKDFPIGLLQSSELPRAPEAGTPMWLTPDCSSLTGINPSPSADLLASPSDSAPRSILAADCDGTMAKQPLIKRKQGIPIPEAASEKLRRKKLRAT